MSSAEAVIVEELSLFQAINYTGAAATTLGAYEYIITLDKEVTAIWKREWTMSSVLLLSIRWVMLLNQLISYVPASDEVCTSTYVILEITISIGFAQVAVFAALRVFALWHVSRHRRVLFAVVLALGLVPVGTNLYCLTRLSFAYIADPFNICTQYLRVPAATVQTDLALNRCTVLFITRACAIAGDLLVLILTWIKTFGQWRESQKLNIQISVTTSLLRDGTIYFVVLLIINVIQLLKYNTTLNLINQGIQVMPAVLVNRFMLNLRQFSNPGDPSTRSDLRNFSRIALHHISIGNVGEPLDHTEVMTPSDTPERVAVVPKTDAEASAGKS